MRTHPVAPAGLRLRRFLRRVHGAVAIRAGALLLRAQQPQAAALLLRLLRARSARQTLARRELARGVALLRAERHAAAHRPLQAATLLAPDDVTAHRRLASCLTALQRWEAATALLERCRESFPGEPVFRAQLGAVLAERGLSRAAVEELGAVADLPGADPRWLRWYVSALGQDGRGDEALAATERLVRRAPEDPRALQTAALVSLDHGRAEHAVTYLREATAHDPSVESFIWLARALLRTGATGEALEAARRAVDAQPDRDGAYAVLGEVLLVLERVDEAREAATEALRLSPDHLHWHLLLARVQDAAWDFEASRDLMLGLVRLRPRDAEVLRAVAGYFAGAGDVVEALALAEQLVELKPRARSYVLVADYLQRLKRIDESVAALRQAIARNPKDAGAMATMATVLARQHRLPEAVEQLEAALALRPDRGKWRLSVTSMLISLRALDLAEQHLRVMLAQDPDDPSARERLVRVLLLQGRTEEAEPLVAHGAAEPRPVFLAFQNYLEGRQDERAFAYLAERHRRILEDVLASRTAL